MVFSASCRPVIFRRLDTSVNVHFPKDASAYFYFEAATGMRLSKFPIDSLPSGMDVAFVALGEWQDEAHTLIQLALPD